MARIVCPMTRTYPGSRIGGRPTAVARLLIPGPAQGGCSHESYEVSTLEIDAQLPVLPWPAKRFAQQLSVLATARVHAQVTLLGHCSVLPP